MLGGGGVLGGAWIVGALDALQRVHDLDVRDVDLVVGTSAGSLIGALLASGAGVAELRAHQLGQEVLRGPLVDVEWDHDTATGGSHPLRPRWGPASAELVRRNAGRLRRLPPTAVLAALAPEGRGSVEEVRRLVREVAGETDWPEHPQFRAVALDFNTGHRVAFGAPGAPAASMPEAVAASCAVPGWFSPVTIGDHRYVDGGAWSATNVDLATGHRLDEVFVLAPLVSFAPDAPPHWRDRMERRWRAQVTRRCLREVARLHADGAQVTVLGPGPEDLAQFGDNMMSVQRRRAVLETSLRTSMAALSDPEPLRALPSAPRSARVTQ